MKKVYFGRNSIIAGDAEVIDLITRNQQAARNRRRAIELGAQAETGTTFDKKQATAAFRSADDSLVDTGDQLREMGYDWDPEYGWVPVEDGYTWNRRRQRWEETA